MHNKLKEFIDQVKNIIDMYDHDEINEAQAYAFIKIEIDFIAELSKK